MNTPLVSCILATYNRQEFMHDALASIFGQTYPNIEVIVVDDASTDNTVEVLQKTYGDRIRLVRRTVNSRTCELSRYQGTREAKGKYCAFLDSDDLWAPEKIAKQVAFLEENPGIPLCHTYFRIIDDVGGEHGIRHEGAVPPTGRYGAEILHHCYITISSVMVRPDVWLEAVAEKDIVDFGMDWDFFLNIARNHPIGFIPEVLGSYRRGNLSVGQHKWKRNPRNIVTMTRILEKEMYRGFGTRAEMKRHLVDACVENAQTHRYAGYPSHAAFFAWYGMKYAPFDLRLPVELGKALARMALPGRKG